MDTGQSNPLPEVYKVIGAPGTGKTTRVVGNEEIEDHTSLVQENMAEYDLDEQLIVTYTKAATEEAAERLYDITDFTKKLITTRVTTIHSQCYSILNETSAFNGMDREQVVQHWNKRNFCDAYDLDFGYDDDEDDIMGNDKQDGNALFDIYNWLQSNLKPMEEWEDCPADKPDIGDIEWHLKAWEDWKDERDLVGFGDMIEEVLKLGRKQLINLGYGMLFPDDSVGYHELFKKARNDPDRDPEVLRGKGAFVDTRVMYVDEVQDLNPLQWAWYLLQKLVCEKVYIGGDDDQTIYGWGGADPEFMLGEEGDFEVLDKTYRIPKNVWEVCDTTIRQVDNRQEKNVTPHGDGGEVECLRAPSPRQVSNHLDGDSNFVLFRARYMIDQFTEDLRELGIPYRNMSTFDTWDGDMVTLRNALSKMEITGEKLTKDEVSALTDNAEDARVKKGSASKDTSSILGSITGQKPEKVKEMFKFPKAAVHRGKFMESWLEFAEELNYYEKEALRGNIQNGNHDMSPERIRLGTIHSAKGREAENVIVALDSTSTIVEGMKDDITNKPGKVISDAERRVYYVAMSRASEKLVLAEGVVNPDTTLKIKNLVGREYAPERKGPGNDATLTGW